MKIPTPIKMKTFSIYTKAKSEPTHVLDLMGVHQGFRNWICFMKIPKL